MACSDVKVFSPVTWMDPIFESVEAADCLGLPVAHSDETVARKIAQENTPGGNEAGT